MIPTTSPTPVVTTVPEQRVPVDRSATARQPALAFAFCVAVAVVWIGAAVLTAGRGFDLTDEGFYLLTYRWWAVDHRNFTGAQYVYGPVFDLLGHDVAALRIFRLVTVVLAHLLFGVSFMRWLRPRRPAAPATPLWEAAGATAIVAAGGAVYGWLPHTPGYNDVVLLGALLGLAAVLTAARHADRDARVPAWLPVTLGALTVPVLLAKWAALPVLALVAAAAVVALLPLGTRGILRAATWALAGAAGAAAFVHLAVVPLTVAVPPMIEVNRLLAGGSMSVPTLLDRYWTYSLPTIRTIALWYGPLLLAAWGAGRARRPGTQRLARVLGVAGLALAGWHALRDGGLGGGAVNVVKFAAPLLAVMLFALVTAVAAGVENTRGRLLLGVLVVLPLVYALGTGNIPLKVSANAFAVWMALLVAILTGLGRASTAARGLTAAVAAAALLATAGIATGGLWRHPYRGVPRHQATATAPGVPALASVTVDPQSARRYGDLRERLAPYLLPAGRPVLGFDKMAGIVFLLDGRSVGEAWYPPTDPARTAAGIAAHCAHGAPWTADRAPILLFNRPVRPADRGVLRPCGLDLDRDYRPLAPVEQTAGLTVLVPR